MTDDRSTQSPRPAYAEASRAEDEALAVEVALDDLDATDSRRPVVDAADDPPSSETPRASALPLARLVALLPDDGEVDGRWGARRRGERIPFSRAVTLTKLDAALENVASTVKIEALFEGWSINVCHGGMRILTEDEIHPGDAILVEVESSGSMYLGHARVCWVRSEAGGVIAGLEFLMNR